MPARQQPAAAAAAIAARRRQEGSTSQLPARSAGDAGASLATAAAAALLSTTTTHQPKPSKAVLRLAPQLTKRKPRPLAVMGLDTCTRDASGGPALDAQDGEEMVSRDLGVSLYCDNQPAERGRLFVTTRCATCAAEWTPFAHCGAPNLIQPTLAASSLSADESCGSAKRTRRRGTAYLSDPSASTRCRETRRRSRTRVSTPKWRCPATRAPKRTATATTRSRTRHSRGMSRPSRSASCPRTHRQVGSLSRRLRPHAVACAS